MRRLDRYLLAEVALPFGVGLALFFVLVAFGEVLKISDAVTGFGISPQQFLSAFGFSIPPLLGLLLPVCTLFSVLLAVGRLSSDRELLALSASGVSPFALLRVPGFLGVFVGSITAVLLLWGEPWGLQGLKTLMARGAQDAIAGGVRPGQFHSWVDGVTFFSRGEENGKMTEVLFADRRKGGQPVVVTARSGVVAVGEGPGDIVLDLSDGVVMLQGGPSTSATASVQASGRVSRHRVLKFERAQYRVDVSTLVRDKLFNVTQAQASYPDQLIERWNDKTLAYKRRALALITLHRKIALPVATLIFALIAVPLGGRMQGGRRASGLLVSAGIVVGYYYLGRGLELSARSGAFPVHLAAWGPNIVGLGVLAVLLWQWRRR